MSYFMKRKKSEEVPENEYLPDETAENEDVQSEDAAADVEVEAEAEADADAQSEQVAFLEEKAVFEAEKLLREQGLPESMASFIADTDAETMKQKAAVFTQAFSEAIETAVYSRLKGRAPSNKPAERTDAFLEGLLSR